MPAPSELRELSDAELQQRTDQLLDRVRSEIGQRMTHATMPTEPGRDWSEQAKLHLAEYHMVAAELTRRGSQRCSRDVSEFLRGMNSEGGLQGDALRRWLDRY